MIKQLILHIFIEIKEDYPARLMKKGGIVAPSTYIEEPIVVVRARKPKISVLF